MGQFLPPQLFTTAVSLMDPQVSKNTALNVKEGRKKGRKDGRKDP